MSPAPTRRARDLATDSPAPNREFMSDAHVARAKNGHQCTVGLTDQDRRRRLAWLPQTHPEAVEVVWSDTDVDTGAHALSEANTERFVAARRGDPHHQQNPLRR